MRGFGLAVFTFSMSLVFASSAMASDFRKAAWGMSISQVKRLEKKGELESRSRESLTYDGSVFGWSCLIGYSFSRNKLVSGAYQFKHHRVEPNMHIEDFLKLKKALSKKYGKPVKETKNWFDESFKDKPYEWGMAVRLGHLAYGAVWETDRSMIYLNLSGVNYKANLSLAYNSKEYGFEDYKRNEKESMEDL